MNEKSCPNCQCPHNKRGKFCSKECYHAFPVSLETRKKQSDASKGKPKSQHMREALSKATKGKSKPNIVGENNPNYGGKEIRKPDNYKKYRESVLKRGQAWTSEHRKLHSKTMLGSSNAMRGRKHTPDSLNKMSAAKKNSNIKMVMLK